MPAPTLPNDTAISLQLEEWNRRRGVRVCRQSNAYYVTAFAGVLHVKTDLKHESMCSKKMASPNSQMVLVKQSVF